MVHRSRLWRNWYLIFWIALPFLLWWALRDVPIREIFTTLGSLNLLSLLALASINAAILLMFAGRWWMILRSQGYTLPYLSLAGYRLAAFGVNYFTPGPQFGGEPLQVNLLQQRSGVPTDTAIASVTLDKLLEILANFTFLIIGVGTILATGLISSLVRPHLLLVMLGLPALPSGYLLFLRSGLLPLSRTLSWLSKYINIVTLVRTSQVVAEAETQVAHFCQKHTRTLFWAVILSTLTWGILILEYWLVFRFLGLNLTATQTIIALTAARLAFLSPLPAGLGVLEAGQVLAMEALGINPAFGITVSLLIRARDVLIGSLGLFWGGYLLRLPAERPLPTRAGY